MEAPQQTFYPTQSSIDTIMTMMNKEIIALDKYYKIGLPFSIVHAILFALVYFGPASSDEAQSGLLIVPFIIADVPVSLLIALDFVGQHGVLGGSPSLEDIVFSPVLIDGILGSIWWYFLPKLFLPKRYGGIWGARSPQKRDN